MWDIHFFEEIDSTNTYCKQIARAEGAAHGTVVIAAAQSGGRGRLGRHFFSPKGTGLYLSLILRPQWDVRTAALVTPCTAVAVAEAVDALCGADTQIKWVNDLYLGGKKLCGILTESAVKADGTLDFLVVGIGLNLRAMQAHLPEELRPEVTSIEEETGCILTPMEAAQAVLVRLAQAYTQLPERKFLEKYRKRSMLTGKRVTVRDAHGGVRGAARVLGIDEECGLVIEWADGIQTILHSGEVSVRQM